MMRHKHADLIHAWAEGASIQFKDFNDEWVDCDDGKEYPEWAETLEYRIKPKEPEYEWQWIYLSSSGKFFFTRQRYKNKESAEEAINPHLLIEKYEPSKREVK